MISPVNSTQLSPPSAADAQSMSPTEKKLRKAATEFEAMLLSKWWSAMRDSGLGGSDQTDPAHDTLDQLGMQALSSAVAGAGGIGLGKILVRDVLSNIARQKVAEKASGD
jgi:Rod binding domain-containing protein